MSLLASVTLTLMTILAIACLIGAVGMYVASRRVQARVRELEEGLGVVDGKA